MRRPAHRASQDITPTSSSLSATAPLLGLLSDANCFHFFFGATSGPHKESTHARQIYRACEGRPRGPAEQQSWAIVSTRTAAATGARTVAEGSEACLRT